MPIIFLEPNVECVDTWRTKKCEKKRDGGQCHRKGVPKNCQMTCGLCGKYQYYYNKMEFIVLII